MAYRPHKNGVDDLVLLSDISNDSINANLKQHHAADEIYVYIGHVLISLNPYKEIRGLYGDGVLKRYKGRLPFENQPHVYALAESVHRTMIQQRDNHCVIISGESGAGKTEASKKIMEYIAFVSSKAAGVVKVKEQILESNPLLEAFGNAKTLRNDNSSRFGKYFEIQFDFRGDPVGGNIRNYLLEKIRVVQQQQGERNFHIFYQLLAGASDHEKKELELYAPKYYQYLNQSGCYDVHGVNDAQNYRETRHAMKVIGMAEEESIEVFRMVAAILHVGNIQFKEGQKSVEVSNQEVLSIAARMLRVSPDQLLKALTNKSIIAGNEKQITSPLNLTEATFSRDALSKTLYGRLFDWIVIRSNDLMYKSDHEGFIIGVLDIYGFEIFDRNSFEQLCINFCNEKLHQIFIELTLKAEQEEYRREQIKWEDVKYYNNKPCVELIERKNGILGFLDEECVFPKGTDQSFLEKLFTQIKGHSNFEKPSIKNCFQVKHYAGDVVYSVEGFLDKNKDLLFPDVIRMFASSQSTLLRHLFERDLSLLKDSKKRPLTAGTQFRNQMQQLMESLMACTPHYIRCIKPNTNKRPGEWNDALCISQIKYLGLFENVRVRRAGYAFRLTYGQFLRRYKMLSSKTWPTYKGDEKEGCKIILTDLGVRDDWAFGTSKIFIKSPETVFKLEELREKELDKIVVKIQRSWRAFQSRKWYLELRAAMQDIFYGKKERRKNSVNRKFWGDYLKINHNPSILELFKKYHDTYIRFADNVWKTNKNYKRQQRTLVITDKSVYVLTPSGKHGYSLTRRMELGSVSTVGLSQLADNFFVLKVDNEYDYLLDNIRKTEIVTCLKELRTKMGRELTIQFSNEIQYRLKSKKVRSIRFETDASAPEGGVLQVTNADNAVVKVPQGLSSSTTPKAVYKPKGQRGGASTNDGTGANYGQEGKPSWATTESAPKTSSSPLAARRAPPPAPAAHRQSVRVPTAIVLFDYAAQAPDELTLKEGDTIEIVNRDASGWWTGRFPTNGKTGLFPGNYVKENASGPAKSDRSNYPYGV